MFVAALLSPLHPDAALAGTVQPSALPYADQGQVNVTSAGYQGGPVVAPLGDAGWLVVWEDEGGSGGAILSRTLGRDGSPLSAEQTVTNLPSGGSPDIARLDDGRFVVVWSDTATALMEGTNPGIYGRFLSASGQPEGFIFAVHAVGTSLTEPQVEAGDGGGFVATWRDGGDVWVRRFDALGAALDDAMLASTLGGSQFWPHIARLDGAQGHALVWTSTVSADGDDSATSVQWRRLDPSGLFTQVERQANSVTQGPQYHPDIAPLRGGGFALVWVSDSISAFAPEGEPSGDGIDLRYFAADGTPVAPETTISFDGGNVVRYPALSSGPDGDVLATWTAQLDEVKARRLGAAPNQAFGPELRVDDFAAATGPNYPRAAIDGEGDIALVWESYTDSPGGDDSDGSVQVRSFTPGRVGHWRFEEGGGSFAGDGAGRVADQAVVAQAGDPAWSWGPPGKGALAFFGNGFADLSPSVDLDIADAGVTLTAWLYLETAPSELPDAFASIYDAAEDNYVLYLDRAAEELRFKVTLANGVSARPGIPEALLPLRRWIHVAGVYRGDGSAAIYLDGELADTHLDPMLLGPVRSVPAQVPAVGRDGVNDRYHFDGRIDEAEVWRRALLPQEIVLIRGPFLFGDGFERGDALGWSSVSPSP